MSTFKYYKNGRWNLVGGGITGDTVPIGSIIEYGTTTAPTGWLVCDGSYVSKTEYSELYSAIGDAFLDGGTAPSGKFRLPDLQGRVPVGYKSSDNDFKPIGKTDGEKTHTLTTQEMPAHNHKVYRSGSTSAGYGSLFQNSSTMTELTAGPVDNTGGGQAHNNLQPYQVVCYIIKAKQSAGVVAQVETSATNSDINVYSCNFTSGTVLYQNSSGSNAQITLNDSITNYKRFDVYCSKGPATSSICSFWQTSGHFTINANCWSGAAFLQVVYQEYEITNATTLTPTNGGYVNYSDGTVTQGAENFLKIYKIIGYKY